MMREQRVLLDWRHGKIGPLEPCVLCGQPALCRSPIKNVPCHKSCAEAWIAAHAQDEAHLARLIRVYTPRPGARHSGCSLGCSSPQSSAVQAGPTEALGPA
jgi:hypothetical protein